MEAFVGIEEKAICLTELAAFPKFLHFDEVLLAYDIGSQKITKKCRLFDECLRSIKAAVNDSNSICFACDISQDDPRQFYHQSALASYIQDNFLPICSSSRRYKFDIYFISDVDVNAGTNAIASILLMPQIIRCSNVAINLRWLLGQPTRLPIEAISNWLAKKSDNNSKIIDQKGQHRFLKIYSHTISNASEMCNHLKEVNFLTNIF